MDGDLVADARELERRDDDERRKVAGVVQRVCTDSEATAAELTAHLEKHPLQDEQDVGEDGTPLMVAAQAVDNGTSIHNPTSDMRCVDRLLALGAAIQLLHRLRHRNSLE